MKHVRRASLVDEQIHRKGARDGCWESSSIPESTIEEDGTTDGPIHRDMGTTSGGPVYDGTGSVSRPDSTP